MKIQNGSMWCAVRQGEFGPQLAWESLRETADAALEHARDRDACDEYNRERRPLLGVVRVVVQAQGAALGSVCA